MKIQDWFLLGWAAFSLSWQCLFFLCCPWFSCHLLSVTQSCLTLWNFMDCSTPFFPVLDHFLEFAQTYVHWVANATQLFHLLSFPSPFAFNFSQHQGLYNDWALYIRWPMYWSFSFSISPSNENSGLISFRIDWFDFAVQETLKSLLQHHSSQASFLWHSAFFTVHLSHPYMTTGKTIAWTRRTFVGKKCLCFWIFCLGVWRFFQGASIF